jgi:C4-dicarboxylate transporter DctM subunit
MLATALLILIVLLALSIPVAAALGTLGLALSQFYAALPLHRVVGEQSWTVSTSFILVAVPLFILLGEIMMRAGIAQRMYGAMIQWLSWLPGGLMHSNIGACALFSATSGSSVATAATIGTVAIGEIDRYRYNERLFLGSLAAGGTLGILIPPSINLIVYGALTDTSIPQLYLAGVLPGIGLSLIFMATILLACLLRRGFGGRPVATSWRERLATAPDVFPPLLIFVVVLGSIYAGLATPTESAALGVVGALIVAGARRQLSVGMLRDVLEGTMRTTAMVMAILLAAYFLNFVIISIGLTRYLGSLIAELGATPGQTLLFVILFYLVLGMFLETLSMMVATVPVVTPIMVGLGYDPVWFGILIVLLIETAMITPPVGINLFVVQGVRGRGDIHDIMIGAAPFVVALLVMIGVLVLWPDLALLLPRIAG